MDWKEFQNFALFTMQRFFETRLSEKNPKGFPKRFEMVSDDEQIIGDAKYLTLVGGVKLPPAKFMEISGHVWLLEHVPARHRFLVFGNQKDVSLMWLRKYGSLVNWVDFYFLSNEGDLELLQVK